MLADKSVLQQLATLAAEEQDSVEESFALTMLEALSPHLPTSDQLSAADLATPVSLKPAAPPVDMELDARDAFLDSIPHVITSLTDALAPVDIRNPLHLALASDAANKPLDAPPHKSKQQLASEAKGKAQQLQACLEEILAVSSDMPEEDFPLCQDEIIAELVAAGVLEPLVACLSLQQAAETRLQAAGAACTSFCICLKPLEASALHLHKLHTVLRVGLCTAGRAQAIIELHCR